MFAQQYVGLTGFGIGRQQFEMLLVPVQTLEPQGTRRGPPGPRQVEIALSDVDPEGVAAVESDDAEADRRVGATGLGIPLEFETGTGHGGIDDRDDVDGRTVELHEGDP